MILEAAHDDPLRAMELVERVTEEWWTKYFAYRQMKGKAQTHDGE